jgi:molybdenum cofactor biosynthesis enzyme MoaA
MLLSATARYNAVSGHGVRADSLETGGVPFLHVRATGFPGGIGRTGDLYMENHQKAFAEFFSRRVTAKRDEETMKIQTLSIVAGSEACNARCPFCISKMTPTLGVELREPEVNWRNFAIACNLAERCGVTTAMFTGKGEPTIFPEQITKYLRAMSGFRFPIIELQTNGILIIEGSENYAKHLRDWYGFGMTTIAISVVHFLPESNHVIYLPHRKDYIDLPQLIRTLHDHGMSVRLACIMACGFIDSRRSLQELIEFAREHKVEQLTIRPVNKPSDSRNAEAYEWTDRHYLRPEQLDDIRSFLQTSGVCLMTLIHGAQVYDVGGQNVCLTDSLTIDSKSEDLRQLIFFPDGHLRYDWQYSGAILL